MYGSREKRFIRSRNFYMYTETWSECGWKRIENEQVQNITGRRIEKYRRNRTKISNHHY